MEGERVKWAMEQYRITQEMVIQGTTEYNILHIPMRARHRFIEIIKRSHTEESVKFWENSWNQRDEDAKCLVGFGRSRFLSECCYDETEVLFWENAWKTSDRSLAIRQLLEQSSRA
jgi:hypothetical protein